MFTDSHAHLDASDILSDLPGVLKRAADAGVTTILSIGCIGPDPEETRVTLELAANTEGVFAAVGVHPHDAQQFGQPAADFISRALKQDRMIAWGEIGLDFYYLNSQPETQMAVFREQIRLAKQADKPIIVHSRQAETETCAILKEEYQDWSGPTGVLHCFTSSADTAWICLDLGFYIGFGGILTFPKADELRQIAVAVPEDRLLIETDSPYLAPVPLRGKRNEPANVVFVAQCLATIRNTSLEQVRDSTSRNFKSLFRV